jgi:hypothetical protein
MRSCFRFLTIAVTLTATSGCTGTSAPTEITLPLGRWTGGSACLSVTADGCDFVAGCGHGQFPRPVVHPDGSFAVGGTYRVEVGPISINPAPPAAFSGLVRGGTIMLTVVPSDPSLKPIVAELQLTNDAAKCAVPCL